jgi:K+-sensing histidine kinase KdpD
LGLAICRTLVEAEGGELLLRNGTVEGCEFIMNLPKNKKDRSQPAA